MKAMQRHILSGFVLPLFLAGCNDKGASEVESRRSSAASGPSAEQDDTSESALKTVVTGYNFVAKDLSPHSVTLVFGGPIKEWAANGQFVIRRSLTKKKNSFKDIVTNVDAGSFVDTGVPAGTVVYYKLYAAGGRSKALATIGRLTVETPSAGRVPSSPGNVSAKRLQDGNVLVTWLDRSRDETEFRLSREVSPIDDEIDYIQLPPNTTSYVDSDVREANTYRYVLKAVNSIGVSSSSNVAEINLSVSADPTPALDLPPSPPQPIDAYLDLTKKRVVNIRWFPPKKVAGAGTPAYFSVQRRAFDEPAFVEVGREPYRDSEDELKFQDVNSGLQDGLLYFYKVVTVSTTGVSSSPVSDSVHLPP